MSSLEGCIEARVMLLTRRASGWSAVSRDLKSNRKFLLSTWYNCKLILICEREKEEEEERVKEKRENEGRE